MIFFYILDLCNITNGSCLDYLVHAMKEKYCWGSSIDFDRISGIVCAQPLGLNIYIVQCMLSLNEYEV